MAARAGGAAAPSIEYSDNFATSEIARDGSYIGYNALLTLKNFAYSPYCISGGAATPAIYVTICTAGRRGGVTIF